MVDVKETFVTIKKQSLSFKVKRSDIISADPTYDGLLFQLKHSFSLQYTDAFMPSEVKNLVCNSINSFPNANLLVDLDNYKKPVVATPV